MNVASTSAPSADPAKDPLLQSFTLKHLTLKNRIMSTSHACGLEERGMPKDRYQSYHEEKAKGGITLTMFGVSSNVAKDSPNIVRQLTGPFRAPSMNKRTDRFGGSLENRCRFGLMVFEEIRRRVGDRFLVGFRFVVDEGAGKNTMSFDECVAIAKIFERTGFIDFFNAIYGRMDTEMALAVHNMPGMASPIAPWLKPVGAFKREVGLPVFHAARASDTSTARYATRAGLLAMVAMTRAHIADPYIVAKLLAG